MQTLSYYKGLRDLVEVLDQKGKLVRVSRPIIKDTELMPLVRLQFRGLPEEERKGFMFDKVVLMGGSMMPRWLLVFLQLQERSMH